MLTATSIDARLPERFRGRVLSVHARAISIATSEDELITVTTPQGGNGPGRFLVPPPGGSFERLEVPEGVDVTYLEDTLEIGRAVRIAITEDTPRWQAPPAPQRATDEAVAWVVKRVHDALPAWPRSDPFGQQLSRRAQALREALSSGSGDLSDAVARLIGFGPGLTPSGDDFLAGVVAALTRAQAKPERVAKSIETHLARTTPVARGYLRYACDGRFAEHIVEVADAILTSHGDEALHAATRALGFGATSGQDMLVGLLDGLRSILPA